MQEWETELLKLLEGRLEAQKLDALAEFAAGVGHELNNPLAVIQGYAEELLRRFDDPRLQHHLLMIVSQTRRAHEMIADIRLFARPPAPQVNSFLLKNLADQFIERMNERWGTGNIHSEYRPDEDSFENDFDNASFRGDFAQLMTILLALGKNAAQATGQSGKIILLINRIRTAYYSLLELVVEDNGPGIPPDKRELIFNPYYSGRQSGRGLGFGLSKSWRLVQGLGGALTVSDSEIFPTGCRFTVRIPEK